MADLASNFKLYAEQLSKNRQLLFELFQANSLFSVELSSEEKKIFFNSNICNVVLHYYQYLKSRKFRSKISKEMIIYFKKHDLTQILCDFNDWLTICQDIDLQIKDLKNQQTESTINQIINSQFSLNKLNSKSAQRKYNESNQMSKQSVKIEKKNTISSKDNQQNKGKDKQIYDKKQESMIKVKTKQKNVSAENIVSIKDKRQIGKPNEMSSNNNEGIHYATTLYKQKYLQFHGKKGYIFDSNSYKLLLQDMPEEVVQCLNKNDHKQKNRTLLAYMLVQPHNASKYSFILGLINHSHLPKQQV